MPNFALQFCERFGSFDVYDLICCRGVKMDVQWAGCQRTSSFETGATLLKLILHDFVCNFQSSINNRKCLS